MRLLCTMLVGGMLLHAQQAFSEKEESSEPVKESADKVLSGFIEESVGKLDAPIVAVFPFRHPDGSASMEGQLLAERVLSCLAECPDVRVVEREHLAKVLEEQKLASEGFIAPETAARTGRLTGARGVVAGTVTEMGELMQVHVRLFAVESGQAVAAKTFITRRRIRAFINPLWDDIDRIKAGGKEFGARLWMEKDRLRIGDTAKVLFRVDRDCYVTIFNFSTDGTIAVLFPNRYQPGNAAKAGRTYEIPAEDGGYKIRARGPAGIERLKLFATSRDVPLYERDYSQAPFGTVTDGDQTSLRGLQAVLDEMGTSDWAEISCEFLIENLFR